MTRTDSSSTFAPELITQAMARVQSRVHRTPVLTSRAFDEAASLRSGPRGRRVFFKCENMQRTGSFKIRGATNRILSLSEEERRRGVIAFSSGNHAQAVAVAAREAGARAVIAMPPRAATALRSSFMIASATTAKSSRAGLRSASGWCSFRPMTTT
jgi:threonine dehydratase